MCLSYDVVIKTSYGGLESDPFWVFINAPHNLIGVADQYGGVWNYTYPYFDGYESRINYKVQNLCGFDPPMSGYSLNESFGAWADDWTGNNWLRGMARGTGVPGDQWYDQINFYSANCTSAPCIPTPMNPSSAFTAVDNVSQSWQVGSQLVGAGAGVQTNTLRATRIRQNMKRL